MTEKKENNHSEGNHPEEIRIPVIQIRLETRKTVLDVEGNVLGEALESREIEWSAMTIPPKPLRVTEHIETNGLVCQARASVGKKRRRRKTKSNLSS